ncbi:hypothetical protein U1Q18_002619 [Sarracenia purpurea var. burkii]
MGLKSLIDPFNSLQWGGRNVCEWEGIKECMNGKVSKLVLEHMNLSGTVDEASINQLDQLRVLSFKDNSINGQIPDLSGLHNLKSLFLNDNNFSGNFPSGISLLHRLKIVVLSGNQISGHIPDAVLNLRRLYIFFLQDNRLTGEIPPLNQSSLRFFNVSNNQLSGEIPVTSALVQFNTSSFSGNVGLCGEQIGIPCYGGSNVFAPSESPAHPVIPAKNRRKQRKIVAIIAGSVGGLILLVLVFLVVLCLVCKNRIWKRRRKAREVRGKGAVASSGEEVEEGRSGGGGGGGKKGGGGFSWEGEGLGSLVFCGDGDQQMSYSLEDLLKASAETLGRGTVGSTYKAVMESGFIVTVKRLKDSRWPKVEEFRRHMEVLGRLSHPNIVPLRAFFQAKEERLLVYDYFPNGSLFSLIHGKEDHHHTGHT